MGLLLMEDNNLRNPREMYYTGKYPAQEQDNRLTR